MALTPEQQAELLYKKLIAGKATTDPGSEIFQEPIESSMPIMLSDIWTESNLIPINPPTGYTHGQITGVIKRIENYELENINGTWSFKDPLGTVTNNLVPFKTGSPYIPILKTQSGRVIPWGYKDWVLDEKTGTLTFMSGLPSGVYTVNASNPPLLSGWQYIGKIGDFSTIAGSNRIEEVLTVDYAGMSGLTISQLSAGPYELFVNGILIIDDVFTVTGTTLEWLGNITFYELEPSDEVILVYSPI